MPNIVSDPLSSADLADFAARFRAGDITAEATVRAYLDRIAIFDKALGCYQHVATEQALETAAAMDRLRRVGTDLGPLMGVPISIKDLFAVDGMPVTAGSNYDVTDIIGPEGPFVKALKRAGCIILGKVKTDEFALGTLGINPVRGSPWNPWDPLVHRAPGGSSSGSAVAVAARLCAFSVGTDTGGSVRGPAAFCGVFGLKTTAGLWPTSGFMPLSTTMDTIGLLTRSAADAALVFGALTGRPVAPTRSIRTVRLGKPINYFFDDVEPEVERCMAAALSAMADAGAEILPVEIPEAHECPNFNSKVSPIELLATLGRDRFEAARGMLGDPVVASTEAVLEILADEYAGLLRRHRELRLIAEGRMNGLDGWVAPTRQKLPMPLAEIVTRDSRMRMEWLMLRNTRPANTFGICASSTPVHQYGAPLPVGLQVFCPSYQEERLLGVAKAVEGVVGLPPVPDLSSFPG